MISDPQDLRWDLLGAEARGEAAESGRGRWGGLRASATGACVRKGAGTHTHGVTPRGRGEAAEDRGPRPATPPLGLRRGRPCCRPPWPPAVRPSFSPPRPSVWCLVTAPRGRDRPPAGNQPRSPCITPLARPQTHTPRRLQPAQRRGAGGPRGRFVHFDGERPCPSSSRCQPRPARAECVRPEPHGDGTV